MSKTDKALLSRFLTSTEAEVLDAFASLPGAIRSGSDYVYIPGKRADRILLVSHADTVNQKVYGVNPQNTQPNPPNIIWMGDVCSLVKFWRDDKENKKVYNADNWGKECHALGADDRAGCAMLWTFKDSGHSILITTGEESGLHGARAAVRIMREELKKHVFALEVDRRGDRQAVFYDVGTEAFKNYTINLLSEHDPEKIDWFEALGSSTDIRHICDEIRMCGINVSAGYVGEHSGTEMLFLGAWQHTRDALKGFLKAEHVVFELPPKPAAQQKTYGHHGGYGESAYPGVRWQDRWCSNHNSYMGSCKDKHPELKDASTNSHVGNQLEIRIFRAGGEKAGEGTVELCLVPVGSKDPLERKPESCSNRQSKKLFKVIQHLYTKNRLSQTEHEQLVKDVIALRDKTRKDQAIVTEEQRLLHAAGIDPHERTEHTPSTVSEEDDDTTDGVPEGYGNLPGMAVALASAAVEREKKSETTVVMPQTSDILSRVCIADRAPHAHHGQYDQATGRCWHTCSSCKRRWHHSRPQALWCRLSYGCFCPDDGSPSVLQMINNSAWGYAGGSIKEGELPKGPQGSTALVIPYKEVKENKSRVSCLHHCYLCKSQWSHVRPDTGASKCDVGIFDSLCPIHSLNSYKAVSKYEQSCGMPGWSTSMHAWGEKKKLVVEDPHTTESNEPAEADVLIMDGKTGAGLGEPEREVGGEA